MGVESKTFELVLRARDAGSMEMRNFNRSVRLVRHELRRLGKVVLNLRTVFAAAGAAMAAKSLVEASNRQAKAVAGLETALESMGRTTPGLSKRLQDLARAMQDVTNFGDEATMQGMKFLVTYRDIGDEMLPRASRVMLDLAALMKGDVTAAANMLGKASMGMTGELRRVGITVDADVYKMKGFTGVLEQIEAQVRGQAAAMREAAGPWEALGNAVGDVKEKLGDLLRRLVDTAGRDLLRYLKEVNKRLGDLLRRTDFRELGRQVADAVKWFVEATASVARFAFEYRRMLAVVAGTALAVTVVGRLAAVVRALNTAFAAMMGMGFVQWLSKVKLGLEGMTAAGGMAAAAVTGLVAAVAAFTGLKVYELARVLVEWKQAALSARDALNRLAGQAAELMRRFRDFKDVRLPDDLTGRTGDELERMNRELVRARAYWAAMLHVAQAVGNTSGMERARDRLKELNDELKRLREQEAFKAVGRDVAAGTKALEEFEAVARRAYDTAAAQAEEYGRKALRAEQELRDIRMESEDRIREIMRRNMTEAEAWADRKKQAEEKLSRARQALARGDYALAEKLARDAERLYAGLAERVEGRGRYAGSVVVKTLEQTTAVARAGIEEFRRMMAAIKQAQAEAAAAAGAEREAAAKAAKEALEAVAEAKEKKVTISLPNLDEARAELEAFVKDEVKTVTVKIVKVEGKAAGGRAGMAAGGWLPGNSRYDTVPVMARPGEGSVRNEALSVWDRLFGRSFFEGVNAPWSGAGRAIREALSAASFAKAVSAAGRIGPGAAPRSESHVYLNMSEGAAVRLGPRARSLAEELDQELRRRVQRGAVFG